MKANTPVVLALVLWLLFVASNTFALFKSPYPPKSYPPGRTTVATGGLGDIADSPGSHGLGNASRRK